MDMRLRGLSCMADMGCEKEKRGVQRGYGDTIE